MYKEDSHFGRHAQRVRLGTVSDTKKAMELALIESKRFQSRRRPYTLFKEWLEAKGWFTAKGAAPVDVGSAPPPEGQRRFIRWNDWVLTPGPPALHSSLCLTALCSA